MFDRNNPYYGHAIAMADTYQIPHGLWTGLINKESGGNPNAHSPAGAHGFTQLMPGTAAQMHVNSHDPKQNLQGGAHYLSNMYHQFHSWPLALAAYNAGPGAVQHAHGVPHISETQDYVRKIMAGYGGGAAPAPHIAMPAAPVAQHLARGGAQWDPTPIQAPMTTEQAPPLTFSPSDTRPMVSQPMPVPSASFIDASALSQNGPYYGNPQAYANDIAAQRQIAQTGGTY